MHKDVNVGSLLSELFSLIGGALRPCAIFVLVVGGLSGIGGAAGFAFPDTLPSLALAGIGLASMAYVLVVAIVTVVASYLLTAELLRSRGRLAEGGARVFSYIGLSILTALGAGFGLILLIVPGIILLVRWSAAPAFLVGRRDGIIEAFSSSWDATRGHSWPIFFAGLIVFIGTSMIAGAGGGMAAGASFSGGIMAMISQIVSALVGAAGNVITIAFPVAIYQLLHSDHTELDEVFA